MNIKRIFMEQRGNSYNRIRYAGVMLKQHSIDSSTAPIEYRRDKTCNCLGTEPVSFFFCDEQRSNGPNEL